MKVFFDGKVLCNTYTTINLNCTSILIPKSVIVVSENVAIPLKIGDAEPLAQDRFPLPSLVNTELAFPLAAGK
jgi:hypothetical protein